MAYLTVEQMQDVLSIDNESWMQLTGPKLTDEMEEGETLVDSYLGMISAEGDELVFSVIYMTDMVDGSLDFTLAELVASGFIAE